MSEKRILSIGDIHGQPDKLEKLLKKVNYDSSNDLLILLGDYVDRGFNNIESLNLVKKLGEQGAIILKGNHEQLLQYAIIDLLNGKPFGSNVEIFIDCGGVNTYNEIKNLNRAQLVRIYKYIANLLLYYEIDKYIFVHAGVDSLSPINKNSEETLLWIKDDFLANEAYEDKIIIFGHSVTWYEPLMINNKQKIKIWHDKQYNDKIGIDCGAVFGGKLACLELPTMKEYYIT